MEAVHDSANDEIASRHVTSRHVICRACHAHCGLIVNFRDGRPIATHGDKNNPAFHGYSCLKGRRLAAYHSLPSRLVRSQKRQSDGAFAPISWREAAIETADRIQAVVDKHGPDAVALYVGTFGYNNLASHAFANAFLEAIGSRMYFTSVTIDQPGKGVARAEHGAWLAGPYRVDEWDGLMLVGTNPVISQNGGLGANPARRLHEAKKRGMQLIVVDPRRTDVAEKADLHLQVRPGEDAAVLAAIGRQIIADGAHDRAFVEAEVEGFDAFKRALAPFDPASVAGRAGVAAEEIVKAARMYGRWRKGHISAGTGPNMSGYGNIVEFMTVALTSIMGHWRREGETIRNEGFFIRPAPPIAAASGAAPAFGFGKKLRTRGLEETILGMPTAALAEEILAPGDGQVRALIVLGGNPVLAWPDQKKTLAAMKALELLVCLDPRMTKTAEHAHYVIAPKLHYEIHGLTAPTEMFGGFGAGWGFEETYGQVSNPIMDVPPGSDLCEEFEFFAAMAARLSAPLRVKSWSLINDPETMDRDRTVIAPGDEIDAIGAWSAALAGAPVPVPQAFADAEIHRGKILNRPGLTVKAKPEGWAAKLVIDSPRVLPDLDRYAEERLGERPADGGRYPMRVISRRLNDIHNSNWHEEPGLRKRTPHHPAFINPADLAAYGVTDGEVIEIESEVASIKCVARSAPDVRPGCLSVPHAWGTAPDEPDDPLGAGGNTGRLCSADQEFDAITGIPIMSAIPVRIRAASAR